MMSKNYLTLSVFWVLMGCAEPGSESDSSMTTTGAPDNPAQQPVSDLEPSSSGITKALYGDLHVHSKLSFDAWIFGTRATPDQAYEFAKGAMLEHASGLPMQLQRPLDFLAVTDHGTYLGMLEQMSDAESSVGNHPLSRSMRTAKTPEERDQVFNEILPRERGYIDFEDDLVDEGIIRSAWQEVIASAERHNDPGTFTTFIGYEFTAGGRAGENLHRNVIFKDSQVPDKPFTRVNADNNPENLWSWMDKLRSQGIESLAIPHNSNGSNGWMFEQTYRNSAPIDSVYSEVRMRNEPLVEITQVKGTSDTHPVLSTEDEWADFEIMDSTIGGNTIKSKPQGSYVREAYLTGLEMSEKGVGNPYQFGLIGSSDTHNAAGSFVEEDFWSKTGLLDITPVQRGSVPDPDTGEFSVSKRQFWGASGLAGVWAKENTRASIYEAFRRKETFATSGPRMQVRFFATYEKQIKAIEGAEDVANAYDIGFSMGSDVAIAPGAEPQFLVSAMRDPLSAPLERLQVIKGWFEDGKKQEQVFDVACASGEVNPTTHRCDALPEASAEDSCDVADGSSRLSTVWQDPDFNENTQAFYYVRALEVSTCRWSTWDAIRAGTKPNPMLPQKIQERVWSSPIWFST